ncbi:MAG: alpha/beta hydrolase [Rhodospirillaceae bacterium]|nr:alpha/beta hydrolase [Rhodospirillaceae bacterium]
MDLDALKGAWEDYDIDTHSPTAQAALAGFRAASRGVAAPRQMLDVAYGGGIREKLDIFAPAGGHAPAVIFFHGGYWRAGEREDRRFPAGYFVPRGVAWVVAGYPLVPAATLPEIVESVRRAVVYLHRRAGLFGLDPQRLVVAGHAAGAHLAAMVMMTDWMLHSRLPPHVIRGAVLLSGLYDLAPMAQFPLGREAGITPENAPASSPLRLRRPLNLRAALGAGDGELPKFRQHTAQFARHLKHLGAAVEILPGRGLDHFGLVGELAKDGPVTRAVLAMTQ